MLQNVATGFLQVTSYCQVGNDELSHRTVVGEGPKIVPELWSSNVGGTSITWRACPTQIAGSQPHCLSDWGGGTGAEHLHSYQGLRRC